MTHHTNGLYDPNKSVEGLKKQILDIRYKDLLQVMRNNSIYRKVTIPDFIFLKDKYYDLLIYYPNPNYNYTDIVLKDPKSEFGITLNIDYLEDDEFIKVIDALDDLINDDFIDYLDELYYEIDDQARIDKIKEELEIEDED